MPRKTQASKTNGHAPQFDLAASVDAGGLLVAKTALPHADGANRSACAEAAAVEDRATRLPDPGAAPRGARAISGRKTASKPKGFSTPASKEDLQQAKEPEIPSGEEPLPLDGCDFVEAVHEQVDLIALEVRLLRSKDDKIIQRELAYLRELRYGTSAPPVDDEPRLIIDLPRPGDKRGPDTTD